MIIAIEWIGEPECEDQTRDLYRIEKARIIGNKYEKRDYSAHKIASVRNLEGGIIW